MVGGYSRRVAMTTAFDALEARAWPIRLLRACAAAFIGLTLALAGHLIGGGDAASLPLILSVLGLVTGAAWLLSSRCLTTGQIVGLLLIAQIVIHLSCVIDTTPTTVGPAMIGGHVFATSLTAFLLARGESFLWALAEKAGLRTVPMLIAISHPAGRVGPRMPMLDERRPPVFVFAGGTGLRGPPVGAF